MRIKGIPRPALCWLSNGTPSLATESGARARRTPVAFRAGALHARSGSETPRDEYQRAKNSPQDESIVADGARLQTAGRRRLLAPTGGDREPPIRRCSQERTCLLARLPGSKQRPVGSLLPQSWSPRLRRRLLPACLPADVVKPVFVLFSGVCSRCDYAPLLYCCLFSEGSRCSLLRGTGEGEEGVIVVSRRLGCPAWLLSPNRYNTHGR